MKVKNSVKAKNVPEDNSEVEEDVDGSILDEGSDDSVDDEEDEETSDESVDGNDSDENAEDVAASATESDEDKEDEKMSDESDDDNDSDENDEDIGASATESDEDVSEDDDDEATTEEPLISKSEKIKRDMVQKYQESHGKRLYIRFPRSISANELVQKAQELSPLIINVHKPRQKYARFCLVDFESKDNRDATLKELKKLIKKGDLEKYQIDIPRTESPEYVQQISELKIKSLENKKLKARLKRASNKAGKLNSFTSSVLVFNLPKTVTVIQVRKLFPAAVDVQIKTVKGGVHKDKSIAAITLPSTMEARAAVKNQHLSLDGNQLIVKFGNQNIKKKKSTKPQHKKKNKQGTVVDKVASDNLQALPSKIPKQNPKSEKKQKATIPQLKPAVTATSEIDKTPNNQKRKFPLSEDLALKKKTKIGNKLPKNMGINKKRKH